MGLLRMLKKKPWVVPSPHPLVECIAIVQPASVPIREMWQLPKKSLNMYGKIQKIQNEKGKGGISDFKTYHIWVVNSVRGFF